MNPSEASLERQIAKYVAEVERVQQMIVTQQQERRWQKWWIASGLVLGVGFFFVKAILGVAVFATGIFLFATGMYLTSIHIYEARGQLERVRGELRALQSKVKTSTQ